MQAYYAANMAVVGRYAFASMPIPDLDGGVHTAGDQLSVVELETADAATVTSKCADFFASFEIPDLDGGIIGARNKHILVKLQTNDTISMAFEDLDGTSAILPICADLEPVLVDVFPRTVARSEIRVIEIGLGHQGSLSCTIVLST